MCTDGKLAGGYMWKPDLLVCENPAAQIRRSGRVKGKWSGAAWPFLTERVQFDRGERVAERLIVRESGWSESRVLIGGMRRGMKRGEKGWRGRLDRGREYRTMGGDEGGGEGDWRQEAGSAAAQITTHIGLGSPSLSTFLSVSFLLSSPFLSLSLLLFLSSAPLEHIPLIKRQQESLKTLFKVLSPTSEKKGTQSTPWKPSRRRCRCWNWTRRMPSTGQSRRKRIRRRPRTNANRWEKYSIGSKIVTVYGPVFILLLIKNVVLKVKYLQF